MLSAFSPLEILPRSILPSMIATSFRTALPLVPGCFLDWETSSVNSSNRIHALFVVPSHTIRHIAKSKYDIVGGAAPASHVAAVGGRALDRVVGLRTLTYIACGSGFFATYLDKVGLVDRQKWFLGDQRRVSVVN